MKKFGKLFVCALLVACGGSSSSHHTAAPAYAPAPKAAPERTDVSSMPRHDESTYASTTPDTAASKNGTGMGSGSGSASAYDNDHDADDKGMGMGSGSGSASAAGAGTSTAKNTGSTSDATPATAGTSMPATGADQMVAKAELKSVKDGSSMGTITFTKNDSGQIQIEGTFTGLGKDGVHALYVHENGDCGNKAKKVGKDLNPTHAKWGPPSAAQRHAGDFGNVTADDTGNATFTMTTDSITMEGDRPDSILNRAVVLHAKKDAKSGAGAALACGVVTMQ